MADKDSKGTELAAAVRKAEARLQAAMSKTIDHKELESARREHRFALHEHQAWADQRAYGSGAREDTGEK